MKKYFSLLFVIITVTALFVTVSPANAQTVPLNVTFEPVVTGLTNPLFVTNAGDGSGRLFIVQNDGKILIYKNGVLNAVPFLDMASVITSGGERGLLGLAFNPNYASTGKFYVYYNNLNGDVEIARYIVSSGDADIADDTSREIVLTIAKPPFSNHNGGSLNFGPDGYLYAGIGDGGSGGDPYGNGQNINVLLGKMLRLDVNGDDFPADTTKNYAIPPDNPFVGVDGSDEIWAYGLRNPWRFSVDKDTGDLYIGDVGQGQYEEVDLQPASSAGGENYGWNTMEGMHCYSPSTGCDISGKVLPIAEYNHTIGCSITGGYVYRGTQFPGLNGIYLYADYCQGLIYGLAKNSSNQWVSTLIKDTNYNITSFGQGEDGELYFTDYSTGTVFHIKEIPLNIATYKSQAINDGYITEANEFSNTGLLMNNSANTLRVGDQATNKQIMAVVSFNTKSLPSNPVVVSAQIHLYKYNTTGTPFGNNMENMIADIRTGNFGAYPSLEVYDFQAAASLKSAATLESTSPSDNWYILNLKPSSFKYINTNGLTQFRIRFAKDDNNNKIADQFIFYSGNYTVDPTIVPKLIIHYYMP